MIWYKIISHDYMDLKPDIGYRLFENDDQAKAYEKHMKENWTGGTTDLAGYATQKEILAYVRNYHIDLDEQTEKNVNNKTYYKQK